MSDKEVPFRMDFNSKLLGETGDGTLLLHIELDERRYDEYMEDGKKHYRDKFLNVVFSEDLISESISSQLSGMPVGLLSSSIGSSESYSKQRKMALTSELNGAAYIQPEQKAIEHREIDIPNQSAWLSIVSIDICSSSRISQSDPEGFERSYEIFIREIGTLIGQFNGHIWKTTGDGLIGYLSDASINSQSDSIVDFALSAIEYLQSGINPALKESKLPTFDIRIGIDSGETKIRNISIPTTNFTQKDLSGSVINRAVKLQESAPQNGVYIGEYLRDNLHVQWLERAHIVEFDGAAIGIEKFRCYKVL
ncbi:adenylate/guanylate cyclase domain-containing protein [Pseudovibrio sp. Ad37]|uniref:adenylate/guanylate cyclase domain-containing protein n=1 Tax=Pseudovibrio sp. Ad37 TaxID=989422 RepID=UPI0007AE9684|nr:adenylate/guanylate cyclase domain-containing protein [Pseudovibrio sp. Ad37]KZL28391.1 Adenylate and Guanylate cyclase catalytic domain protein [Pseudovibrio sp. Ad37]